MQTPQVLILVACIVGMDLFVVPLIIGAFVRAAWTPMVERYPAVEPAPDAVRRGFQSFNSGSLNFGGCIHVAVDHAYQHLRPAWLARRLGAGAASIPWDRIAIARSGARKSRARIDGTSIELTGPRWCMELASGPDTRPGNP